MQTKRGTFIVLYGINNLGKTTQAQRLTKNLLEKGIRTEQIKYPLYDLKPTGPILYAYLRENNPYNLSPTAVQIIYAMNKSQYAPQLEEKIESGITIVAEDYVGTSIAWGAGTGVDIELLEQLNSGLRKPDIAILLDGKRFKKGVEKGHLHEEDDDLTKRVREAHKKLAAKEGWQIVAANQTLEKVEDAILQIVKKTLQY